MRLKFAQRIVVPMGVVMGNLLKSFTILVYAGLAFTSINATAASNHTFTTELQEVRAGSIDGKDYLTIHIDSSVGPASCQGSVLRVDTQSLDRPGEQHRMESVALAAMLTSERVRITVPLNTDQCVDGMPTLTDINLVNTIQ